jgi:hypothetical protein
LKIKLSLTPEQLVAIGEDIVFSEVEKNRWSLQPLTYLFLKEVIRKTTLGAERLLAKSTAMTNAIEQISYSLEGETKYE